MKLHTVKVKVVAVPGGKCSDCDFQGELCQSFGVETMDAYGLPRCGRDNVNYKIVRIKQKLPHTPT